MMVVTKKIKKRDILFAVLIVAAILAVLLIPTSGGDEAPDAAQEVRKIETNEDRIAFLQAAGRDVDAEPVAEQEVRIPADGDDVFSRYNELQMSQGYDLGSYAGKTVTRYVYHVKNDPSGDPELYATIYVYNGEVIGGDVASHGPGGKMRALSAA